MRAGKAHVAVGRMQRQRDEIVAMQRHVPDALAEALGAAMQRVLAQEIGVGLVVLAGDGEAAAGDAVGIAAGDRAHIGRMRGIVGEMLEAEHQRRVMAGEPADPGAPRPSS